jgi:hypothetical protein
METKFELDTQKASKATVAVAAAYGLGRVFKGTKCSQLAAGNAISLTVIIVVLYGPRLALKGKKNTPPAQE